MRNRRRRPAGSQAKAIKHQECADRPSTHVDGSGGWYLTGPVQARLSSAINVRLEDIGERGGKGLLESGIREPPGIKVWQRQMVGHTAPQDRDWRGRCTMQLAL